MNDSQVVSLNWRHNLSNLIIPINRPVGNVEVGAPSLPLTTPDLDGTPAGLVLPTSAGRGIKRPGGEGSMPDAAGARLASSVDHYLAAEAVRTSLDTRERSVISPPGPTKPYRPPRPLQPKDQLINLLISAGYQEKAEQVAACCVRFHALRCGNGHVVDRVPTSVCDFRLCPDCARRRQAKAFKRLYPVLEAFRRRHPGDRPVLITLTVRSSQGPLLGIVQQFKDWFRKLRRSVDWKRCIRGAIAGFEMTRDPEKGWHFHVHILAFRKQWWAQGDLAAQWAKITGGEGQVVDIRAAKDFRGAVQEVLKYVFKPAELEQWGMEQVREFMELKGVKLSECYGELRGLKVESAEDPGEGEGELEALKAGDRCPHCESVLVGVLLPRAYFYNTT